MTQPSNETHCVDNLMATSGQPAALKPAWLIQTARSLLMCRNFLELSQSPVQLKSLNEFRRGHLFDHVSDELIGLLQICRLFAPQ